jgi:hypothetical protein
LNFFPGEAKLQPRVQQPPSGPLPKTEANIILAIACLRSKPSNHHGNNHAAQRNTTNSPAKAVKPQPRKTPRQSTTFAWRSSYHEPAILDTEIKRKPRQLTGAFFFVMTILAVTHLE